MKYSPLFAATMVVCAVGSVAAAEYKAGSIEIDHAWSRATPKGASTGAGYLTIRDPGVKFLIAASIPPLRAITPGSRIFVRSAHSSGTRITLIRAGTVAIGYRVEAVGARATEQGAGPVHMH